MHNKKIINTSLYNIIKIIRQNSIYILTKKIKTSK